MLFLPIIGGIKTLLLTVSNIKIVQEVSILVMIVGAEIHTVGVSMICTRLLIKLSKSLPMDNYLLHYLHQHTLMKTTHSNLSKHSKSINSKCTTALISQL